MMVWVDLETTGLERDDAILEIAVAITDDNLNIGWSIEKLLLDPHEDMTIFHAYARMMDGKGPAYDMHIKNGLLSELNRLKDSPELLKLADVDSRIVNFLRDHLHEPAPLCGSSVHFDRGMIQNWLPRTANCELLHYRNIDVSSLKELFSRWYPLAAAERPQTKPEDKEHRAWADLLASINELKWYRKFILPHQSQDEQLAVYAAACQAQVASNE